MLPSPSGRLLTLPTHFRLIKRAQFSKFALWKSIAKMVLGRRSLLLTLLFAYGAQAAPISLDRRDQVQSVVDAFSGEIEKLNYPYLKTVLDDIEATLKANGALEDEHVAALNQTIKVSRCPRGSHIVLNTCHIFFTRTTHWLLKENRHRR